MDRLIQQAADLLRRGGVVAVPTETVYGLGANALDAVAVARIFEIKGRPRFDPLIVHVDSADAAWRLCEHVPDAARKLADRFWPGPLTIVLPKTAAVPDIVTAGLPSVALRVPAHPMALALIRAAGVPVAAPSANPFGRISPTTAQHVVDQLGDKVDMILDGGACETGVESTVVSLVDEPTVLRPGGTPIEAIEQVIGPLRMAADEEKRPTAPGQLPEHYAPRTPLFLHAPYFWPTDEVPIEQRSKRGLLALSPPPRDTGYAQVEVLSARGDLREAAANLFAAMHRLDATGLDAIDAERVPDQGLGRAINDRLRRAAKKH